MCIVIAFSVNSRSDNAEMIVDLPARDWNSVQRTCVIPLNRDVSWLQLEDVIQRQRLQLDVVDAFYETKHRKHNIRHYHRSTQSYTRHTSTCVRESVA